MAVKAVIFDLDGVIVSTDEYHYLGWKNIADFEEIKFDREINEMLRGVSRMESLEIILRGTDRKYSEIEKEELATKKNEYYKVLLNNISPDDILVGVSSMLKGLKDRNILIAIGSSSKNAGFILKKIGLLDIFDQVVDGNDIKNSKPDPEVFLKAAQKLGLAPEECIVIEDANAGVDAAVAAGMKVVGVGSASNYAKADYRLKDLTQVQLDEILA